MTGTEGRDAALDLAAQRFESRFLEPLAAGVAIASESQRPEQRPELDRYLDFLEPILEELGCSFERYANPVDGGPPLLIAERIEDERLRTVLLYGHGDVVGGMEDQWQAGEGPWRLAADGDRLYGRGVADNKGQHLLNLAALAAVLETRGRLGFNLRILIESGEETGSPGLKELAERNGESLAADLLIASDGPRLQPGLPTLFLGNRGALNFRLKVDLREGEHHSGNWGGALANPAIILAQALATITDARGDIAIPAWRPDSLTPPVRAALKGLELSGGSDAPAVDADWGRPDLTPIERVMAWNSFEILSLHAGRPPSPQNAIPGHAEAICQLRFVVGTDIDQVLPALREHLDHHGFDRVTIEQTRQHVFTATRTDVDHPAVREVSASIERTVGKAPAVLPNFGGSLPNEVFARTLDMPTIWIPHSYAGCGQHGPDEHGLRSLFEEAMALMTGIFWDLGAGGKRSA